MSDNAPTVWVPEIWHDNGTYVDVFVNQEGAFDGLATYVDQCWDDVMGAKPKPESVGDAIAMYFQNAADEGYDITDVPLRGAKSIELEIADA